MFLYEYIIIFQAVCFYPGGKDGFQASEKATGNPRRESQI